MPLDLKIAFVTALTNLYNENDALFDYWYHELYAGANQPIVEKWTIENLNLIEQDVQVMIENPA